MMMMRKILLKLSLRVKSHTLIRRMEGTLSLILISIGMNIILTMNSIHRSRVE